ncbi:MAG: hypothetical protein HFACDABA_00983 [Anaerolineales bacterium]|nr:hypothetical protein [Anaerolineales bacterium]
MQTPDSKKKKKTSYAALLLLAALILFIVGGYPLAKQLALDTFGVKTTGRVIALTGSKNKAPIVQFTTADGREVEFKSGLATNLVSFAKGEKVEIQYLTAAPAIAEVTLLGRLDYFSSIGATCLGIFFLMGGLVALRSKPLVLDFGRKKP